MCVCQSVSLSLFLFVNVIGFLINIFMSLLAAAERVGGAIKDRVVVRYVNDFGEDESGERAH